MWIIRITPPGENRRPRTDFARTDEQVARIVTDAWHENKHNKVQVFKDEAPLVAEYAARERNGLYGYKLNDRRKID